MSHHTLLFLARLACHWSAVSSEWRVTLRCWCLARMVYPPEHQCSESDEPSYTPGFFPFSILKPTLFSASRDIFHAIVRRALLRLCSAYAPLSTLSVACRFALQVPPPPPPPPHRKLLQSVTRMVNVQIRNCEPEKNENLFALPQQR